MPNKKDLPGPGDFTLAAVVIGLVIFGIVMVFSASSYDALSELDDPYYYLKLVSKNAALGVAAMLAAALVPLRRLYSLSPLILIFCFVLLLLLFTPLGETRNNATRWIPIMGFTIMPGEIAKIGAILFVAWFLCRDAGRIRSFGRGVLPLLLLCGALFAPIYKQPNLSTAITVCAIILAMMFIAGMSLAHVGWIGAAAASAVAFLIVSDGSGYQMSRISGFLNPFENPQGSGYQVMQSLLGLGAGGVFGVGLGKSIQKAMYLPEGHNDFILAIIGEELGLVGCILLLAAYMLLIYRGAYIAIRSPSRFGTLVAAGITVMFAMQVVMNVLVVTAWMPPTGVALPFVSYGGNALTIYMGLAGILLNVSRYMDRGAAASGAGGDGEAAGEAAGGAGGGAPPIMELGAAPGAGFRPARRRAAR
ncbi:MAG: putative lipid II flippase FtsW [Clostridiales Family XIII bacterium]|jgi:cell division protein FtsW|nr:putative lipid II flippase FtsW [Clostridiales Family XIII bacterium]